jgi:hypothetical protein
MDYDIHDRNAIVNEFPFSKKLISGPFETVGDNQSQADESPLNRNPRRAATNRSGVMLPSESRNGCSLDGTAGAAMHDPFAEIYCSWMDLYTYTHGEDDSRDMCSPLRPVEAESPVLRSSALRTGDSGESWSINDDMDMADANVLAV